MTMETDLESTKCEGGGESSPGCSGYSSMVHSKKVIKHALRQQAKRRRKNTTIAAGNSRTLPRIVVKPLPPPPPDDPPLSVSNVQRTPTTEEPTAATMKEVLASLPGFSFKSGRRRSTKRLSAAAQLEAGLVDLESPASILTNTSLRALLNRHTFQGLPPLYQRKLAQLLPAVDRQDAATSGLNNEFFARACLEWRKRLAEGEFTPENQQRLKMEAERDKNKLDPWKLKHFEPIWGEKREPKLRSGLHCAVEPRSAGAVTRSSLRLRLESTHDQTQSDLISCPVAMEERVEVESYVSKTHVIPSSPVSESQTTIAHCKSVRDRDEDEVMLENDDKKEVLLSEKTKSPEVIVKFDPDPLLKEISTVQAQDICTSEDSTDLLSRLPASLAPEFVEEEIEKSEELASDVPDEEVSHLSEEHDLDSCKIEINQTSENQSSCDDLPLSESISDTHSVINSQPEVEESTPPTTTVDGEPQIPEEMEIDSETLRRIHELEVRGEMREVYEEISGCPENIYPILESMEIGSSTGGESDNTVPPAQVPVNAVPCEMTTGNEEDAFIDANNYVLESREIRSELLGCNWPVDPTVNSVGVPSTHEELQVPWPLVAAALDGSVAANITVTTQDDCNDSSTSNEIESVSQTQSINNVKTTTTSISEGINCVQIPVDQGASYQAETLTVGTPVTTCLLNDIPSDSPPIIAFPQLQSIRFVQTSFHPEQNNSNSVPISVQNKPNPSPQLGVPTGNQEEAVVQISSANIVARSNVTSNVIPRGQIQNNPVCVPSPNPGRGQERAIVVQQQAPIVAQPRQIVTAAVQQQFPTAVTASSRSRPASQGGQRGSRSGNKEQGGGRSRSSTKEPPGAVNLERSYQICQAVIQSSPNRDQLKAHLKPPPSLLARADGAFTTTKPGGRSLTSVKTQKSQQAVHTHVKHAQNKGQAVMLRHVFATARQAIPTEVTENGTVAQIGPNGTNGLGQYILVQRTGVGDGAPRASSAPPLPPQIASMGVGLHLVRGRPASAGEGSHQAVTLKARGSSDGRGGGGAEPGAPGVIMGGDPPPPCECNMRGAMVICRQCGAFCHDDCIGPQRICATCLIR